MRALTGLEPSARHRNLAELCLLRGVLLTLLVGSGLWLSLHHGLALPLASVSWILAGWLLLTVLTLWRLRQRSAVDDDELFLQLLGDVLLLSALFSQTGGHSNPFVTYYLVPLAIAASTLAWRQTLTLAVTMLAAYSSLFWLPKSQGPAWPWDSYHGHLLGMWFNFLISAVLLVVFVSRMQQRLRDHDRQQAVQQRQHLQQDQALAVGTLAATAVHELATPLASLTLLSDELAAALAPETPDGQPDLPQAQADLLAMQSALARCRDILGRLREQARSPQSSPAQPVQVQVEQLLVGLSLQFPDCRFLALAGTADPWNLPMPWRLQQVLHTLLVNAAEAASGTVSVQVDGVDGAGAVVASLAEAARLRWRIADDGPGWPADVLASAGRPRDSSKPEGFGWGLFLSELTVTALGGRLDTLAGESGGAVAQLSLPLPVFSETI